MQHLCKKSKKMFLTPPQVYFGLYTFFFPQKLWRRMLLLRPYFGLSRLFCFTHSSPREALMMLEMNLIKMAGYIWARSCVMGLPLGFLFRGGVLLEI